MQHDFSANGGLPMTSEDISGELLPAAIAPSPGPSLVSPMSLLPPPGTRRWVIRRKAAVVQAVRSGAMSLEEACERYNLSVEEFLSWQRLIDRHGVRGLRTTRLQEYRATAEPV